MKKSIGLAVGLLMLLALGLAACGADTTPAPPANNTAVSTTTSASETTKATNTMVAPATGPGSELQGKLIATKNTDVRVTRIARLDNLKSGAGTINPKNGIFLAVFYEMANVSQKPVALDDITLYDDQNTQLKETTDINTLTAFYSLYPNETDVDRIQPGFVAKKAKLYDVAKEASGFRVEAQPDYKSDRQPSADSFANPGGKGSDSGAGQELTGKTYTTTSTTDNNITFKAVKVDRLTELKAGTVSRATKGAYLVVVYELQYEKGKSSTVSAILNTPALKDSAGRLFSGESDSLSDLAKLAKASGKYADVLKPNTQLAVYEVTKDAANFEPAAYK
jgi:hypothetical protein